MSSEGWVYTINHESRHLIIENVPSYGVIDELVDLCGIHGEIEEYRRLDTYPSEQFTQAYLISYSHIQDARTSKRKLNGYNFFSQLLHTRYAPEFESVHDTQQKLAQRRRDIGHKTGDPDARRIRLERHQQLLPSAPHAMLQGPTMAQLIHPPQVQTAVGQTPQIAPPSRITPPILPALAPPIQKKQRRRI
ncbi:RNA-binding protein 48 [Podila verticillata]|nr:RNA-binding protein 48 [Podila verticillata]